jgi:hypothetical protein
MAGELVPLVLLPRYTTYAGKITDSYFTTVGMDVTQFEYAIVNFWRGKIVGTAGTPEFTVWFEESTDQSVWSECTGSPPGGDDPGENTEVQWVLTLKKRWFRVRIQLGEADNVVSCWAVGFLEERLR